MPVTSTLSPRNTVSPYHSYAVPWRLVPAGRAGSWSPQPHPPQQQQQPQLRPRHAGNNGGSLRPLRPQPSRRASPPSALLTVVKAGAIQQVKSTPTDKVNVWPHLLAIEFVALMVVLAGLIVFSIFVNAPLLEFANFNEQPNPSKAPWYFLGLQELLSYFDPQVAGVLIPGFGLLGLGMIPYVDKNPAVKPSDRKAGDHDLQLLPVRRGSTDHIRLILPGPGVQLHLPLDETGSSSTSEQRTGPEMDATTILIIAVIAAGVLWPPACFAVAWRRGPDAAPIVGEFDRLPQSETSPPRSRRSTTPPPQLRQPSSSTTRRQRTKSTNPSPSPTAGAEADGAGVRCHPPQVPQPCRARPVRRRLHRHSRYLDACVLLAKAQRWIR